MLVMHSEWHFCSYPSYYAGNLAIMKLVLLTCNYECLKPALTLTLLCLFQQMYLLKVAVDKSVKFPRCKM